MEGNGGATPADVNSAEDLSDGVLDMRTSHSSVAQSDSYDESLYRLHRYAYEGDLASMNALLFSRDKTVDVSLKDMHGNTALHIAAMLGRKECAQVLLAHDSPVNSKNLQGQTPLNEAISFGNRSIISTMLYRLRAQTRETIDAHQSDVEKALNDLNDFQVSVKWEFHSWVPLVSRFLPCDTCHIYKKGCYVRMDTTLIDFKDMKWERGNLSFLFNGTRLGSQSLLVMDNEKKVYQWIRDESEEILAGDVDIMMSTDNETGKLSTKDIKFSRAHSGIIFRETKTEMIGNCLADFYNIQGIKMMSVKRREHLTDEDIKANRVRLDHASLHNTLTNEQQFTERQSLPPPVLPDIPWATYWTAPAGKPPCIGRQLKCKRSNKTFQATVAMSSDFPVTVDQILTVLESIKPLRHFKKLREFLSFKLPPGFPIKLDIPVFPTVTAKIGFEDFQWKDDLVDEFFKVPSDYKEDSERFAGL